MSDAWIEAIRRLYRELDAELSRLDAHCRGCGRCCRFDEAEHVLYASGLERRYLVLAAPAVSPPVDEADLMARGLRCPYQENDRCAAREGRVLGCRLYHCEWGDEMAEEECYARWHDRLKRLHEELGEEWNYRPLLPLDNAGNA